MLVKNLDIRSGLANGTLGRVEGFSPITRFPIVRFTNSNLVQIMAPATFERKKQDTVLASRKQIPLIVSYAMTAHKAQGLTLDRVSVTLKDVFADSHVYVILSRVKTMEGLRIQDDVIHKSKVKANRRAIEFYEDLMNSCNNKRVKVS